MDKDDDSVAAAAIADLSSKVQQLRVHRDDLRKTIRRLSDALHTTEAIVEQRDAMLPVVEAAKAWRESLNLVEQIDASDEELALADALGMPITLMAQP